jgi:hypothetical protein
VGERKTVECPGRVIGHDDGGSGCGHVSELFGGNVDADAKAFERLFDEVAAWQLGVQPAERRQPKQRIEHCRRNRGSAPQKPLGMLSRMQREWRAKRRW